MCLSRRTNTAGRAEICAAGTFLSFIRFSFLDRSREHCQNIDPPGQQDIFYQEIQDDQSNSKIDIGKRKFPPVFLLSGPSVKKPGTKKPYRRQSAVGHKRMIKEA